MLTKALHHVQGPGEPRPGALITGNQRKGTKKQAPPSHTVRLLEDVSILFSSIASRLQFQ